MGPNARHPICADVVVRGSNGSGEPVLQCVAAHYSEGLPKEWAFVERGLRAGLREIHLRSR